MTTRNRTLLSILTSLALLAHAGIAIGQEPSKRWKRQNDRGNRFEGRIEIPVGRPSIDVLSFFAFREPYSGDEKLMIRFFVPEDGELLLRARELEERVQYWMEAKEWDLTADSWNDWGPWPVGQILAREEIPAGNLGILIRLQQEDKTTLLPAFVYHSAPPETLESYTLHLRPSSDLSEITYRLYQGDEELTRDKLVDLTAFEPMTIKLDAADLPEGLLRLELSGKIRGRVCGDDTSTRCPGGKYTFYHRGLEAESPAEDSPSHES